MAVYTDNFNRADGAPGSNWATNDGNVRLEVLNNAATGAGGGYGPCGSWWNGGAVGNDHYAQAVYAVTVPGGGSFGPMVRYQSDRGWTQDGYKALTSGVLQKSIYGGITTLGSYSAVATGKTIRAEASGSTITVKVDGSEVLSVTDSEFASGKTSIVFYQNPARTVGSVDNFECGDLAAGLVIPVAMHYMRLRQ